MAGPTRPTPPSAMDGYRRLERTRRVAAGGHVPVASAVVPPRRRIARGSRLAGLVRLAMFVGVIAIVVGTSMGLASADSRSEARRDPLVQDAAKTKSGTHEASARADAAPADDAAPAEDAAPVEQSTTAPEAAEQVVEETVAVAAAESTPAATATGTTAPRTAALPFTGEPSLDRFLLAGGSLVLLGMLLQIAGQPLPANRARVRTR